MTHCVKVLSDMAVVYAMASTTVLMLTEIQSQMMTLSTVTQIWMSHLTVMVNQSESV